jgi:hypothetical protein
MTLKQFIKKYDFEGSVVLLEGKRTVTESDIEKLISLGKLLASKTKHILFRSGNASGADYYFSCGVASVNPKRLQSIIPYRNHRQRENNAYYTISLDEINIVNEPDVIYQSKFNKKTENLIDNYVSGNVNRFTIKSAYILRDTVKVIGTTNINPADFGIFYDDLANPMSGGTGHTMKICTHNSIPFINQSVWFNWLN